MSTLTGLWGIIIRVLQGGFIKQKTIIPCPRCGEPCEPTRHHVFPKRWWKFWTGKEKREKVLVCRKCHDGYEETIHEKEKCLGGPLPREEYLSIAGVTVAKAA